MTITNLVEAINSSDRSWMAEAACRNISPDIFFPEKLPGKHVIKASAAKKICMNCSVQEECLNYGLKEAHGIWGGLAPRKRQHLRNLKTGE